MNRALCLIVICGCSEVIHFVYVEVAADQLVLHPIDGTGVEFDSLVVGR